MRRDDVVKLLTEHRLELARFRVKTLALFGSVARDDASEASDIDFLVEFEGKGTFDRYMGLKLWLEDLLGRPVDLVTRRSLKAPLRSTVEKELIPVA